MKTIKIDDAEYPFLLKQISNPPKQLYLYGKSIDFNQNLVTVIGTSNPDLSGRRETVRIVKRLVKRGWTIVTSITQGIDEIVCKTTLENNGNIIVVIPGDIEKIQSEKYQNRIRYILENNGNIITEYDRFQEVLPENYLGLNRILAGISKKLIIIEAGMTSGTVATAKVALEENREIYAVIGDLKSHKKVGTNFLVKQGAKPIISVLL
jgi:DNA processing protein